MNDNNDELINDISQQLRSVDVSAGLREVNRKAIQDAIKKQQSELGWWQKTIRIPRFAAACVLLVLAFQLVVNVYSLKFYKGNPVVVASESTNKSVGRQEDVFESQCSQSSVYLAGVGFISKTVNCYWENNYESN